MTPYLHRRSLALAMLGTATRPAARAMASALPVPSSDIILTISGKISVTNRQNTAVFDRPMLEGLGMSSFTTTTPWYDGRITFEGVPMASLMQAVGARGETVTALALNDYATEIPMSDFSRYGVLLALKRDGAYMPVRDKGPLFIIYPFDSDAALKNMRYYSRSAWQVAQLIVS